MLWNHGIFVFHSVGNVTKPGWTKLLTYGFVFEPRRIYTQGVLCSSSFALVAAVIPGFQAGIPRASRGLAMMGKSRENHGFRGKNMGKSWEHHPWNAGVHGKIIEANGMPVPKTRVPVPKTQHQTGEYGFFCDPLFWSSNITNKKCG